MWATFVLSITRYNDLSKLSFLFKYSACIVLASILTGASNSGSRNLTRFRLPNLVVVGSGNICILCLIPTGPFAEEVLTPIPPAALGTELELGPARLFSFDRLSLTLFLVPVVMRRGLAPAPAVFSFKGGSIADRIGEYWTWTWTIDLFEFWSIKLHHTSTYLLTSFLNFNITSDRVKN